MYLSVSKTLYAILMFFCMVFTPLFAQEALKPLPSPYDLATMKYEDTYVKVTYCRPHKRDREVFGKLVPYDKIWRTGANQATEITITEPVMMAGQEVPAGTYTLFSIPNPDKWTIVLNTDLGQWGAYKYDAKYDLLRFDVPVETLENPYEAFTIEFEQKNDKADMVMMWDKTRVTIPIEF